MRQTLHAMVQEAMMSETALTKFRALLTDDEQEAFDSIVQAVRGRLPTMTAVSQLAPLESALLLLAVQQNQRIERLELLLQRLAQRYLEMPQRPETVSAAPPLEASPRV